MKRTVFLAVAALGAVAYAEISFSREEPTLAQRGGAPGSVLNVTVARPREERVVEHLGATGTLVPCEEVIHLRAPFGAWQKVSTKSEEDQPGPGSAAGSNTTTPTGVTPRSAAKPRMRPAKAYRTGSDWRHDTNLNQAYSTARETGTSSWLLDYMKLNQDTKSFHNSNYGFLAIGRDGFYFEVRLSFMISWLGLEAAMGEHYSHLSLPKRHLIASMFEASIPVRDIAARPGRHRGTIHREISRNFYHTSFRDWFGNDYQGYTA